jgi:hypothetical protein
VSSDVVRGDLRGTELIIVSFVGFSRIFLLEILILKWLTARRRYKSFGAEGLSSCRTAVSVLCCRAKA